MIAATVIRDRVWCGRPGCHGRSIGSVRLTDGRSFLDLSRRWRWHGDAEPPRWERHAQSRSRGIPNDRGAAELRADASKVTSGYGRIDLGVKLAIPLPTTLQCPACEAVQTLGNVPHPDSLDRLYS
jgi:hypothetical protein